MCQWSQVDAAPRSPQHALDQVAHLVGRQDGRGQLGQPAPGHEHLRRFVDPDLLDRGVLEVRLQRAEPGDRVEDLLGRLLAVDQHRQAAVQRPLVVVRDDVVDQLADLDRVPGRVETGTADQLADLALDDAHGVSHDAPSPATSGRRQYRH